MPLLGGSFTSRAVDPLLEAADYVISFPGHRVSSASFGVRLAQRVSAGLQKPFLETACSLSERPAAKTESDTTQELETIFSIPGDVRDQVVLIVDDVFMSGRSMAAVATVAQQAGARGVVGLVGARTLKRAA